MSKDVAKEEPSLDSRSKCFAQKRSSRESQESERSQLSQDLGIEMKICLKIFQGTISSGTNSTVLCSLQITWGLISPF
jgi:hypothetical protein